MRKNEIKQWGDWDADLSRRVRVAERPGILRTLAAIFAHSGDSWLWILGLACLWVWGNETWKARTLLLVIGVIGTAILVMAMKFTIRRKRPEGEWGSIYRNTDPHSFPSGHAARATMLAVLASSFNNPWITGIMVVWAPLVSLARVAMGLHYLSDIIGGMVIGILIGLGILLLVF